MPAPETNARHQKAVLWPFTGTYDDYGQPVVGEPEEVVVRWNTGRAEALDPLGNTIALDAEVVVNQRVEVGGNMALGELSAWEEVGTGDTGSIGELMQVLTYNETPDLKGRAVRRTVGLKRFRDALPEQA
jgi:hypothetical protein